MSWQRKRLDRLKISNPCNTTWEEMKTSPGDNSRRFCGSCQREVFDFAQMTPRQIQRHLRASRGQLCARLTYEGGRLRFLSPEPVSEPLRARRPTLRPSPLAASLVTAWLGVGATQAGGAQAGAVQAGAAQTQTSAPGTSPRVASFAQDGRVVEVGKARTRKQTPGASAVLRGRVVDRDGHPVPGTVVVAHHHLSGDEQTTITREEGVFVFEGLVPGLYELHGNIEGFTIEPLQDLVLQAGEIHEATLEASISDLIVVGGAVAVVSPTLRTLFDSSELVATVVVEDSELLRIDDELEESTTWLRIERVLKGRIGSERVALRQDSYYQEEDTQTQQQPGARALAFLVEAEDFESFGAEPTYEATSYVDGLRYYEGEELKAYLERLEALVDLHQSGSGNTPAEIMAWLVDTVENPHTRHEANREISRALEALEELIVDHQGNEEQVFQTLWIDLERARAELEARSEPPPPALLGAAITTGQQKRLTRALQATEGLDKNAIALLELVSLWDEPAASAWLGEQLRADEASSSGLAHLWLLEELAGALGDEEVSALAEADFELVSEIESLTPEDDTRELERLRQDFQVQRRDLQDRLAEAIARRDVRLDPDWF